MKNTAKEQSPKIIAFLIFYGILMLVSNFDFLLNILSLVIINIGIDYVYEIRILSKKHAALRKYENAFNESYFDIYWNFNKVQLQLMMSLSLGTLSILSVLPIQGIFEKFLWGLILFLLGLLFAVLIFLIGNNHRILHELTTHKQQEYTSYTDKEMRLLNKLK